MKKRRILPVILAFLSVCICVWATTDADRRKARHYLLEGIRSEVLGDIGEAYTLYSHAHNIDPSNKDAAYRYGLFTMLSTDTSSKKNALKLMGDYVDAYPDDYYDVVTYAEMRMRNYDYAEAFRVLKRLFELNQGRTDLPSKLGEIALYMNEPDTAIYYFELDEKLDEMTPYSVNMKRYAYMQKNDTLGAISTVDDALKLQPKEPLYWIMKASIHHAINQEDTAKYYFTKAADMFPDNFMVKNSLGQYYKEMGDTAQMEAAILESMLCEDGDLEDKIDLFVEYVGPLLEKKENTAIGDTIMASLISQYPYEATVMSIAAEYSSEKGDYDKAIEQAQIAIDMDPENDKLHNKKLVYLMQGAKYNDAIDYFNTFGDEYKDLSLNMLYIAGAYQGAERYEEGLAMIDKLIRQEIEDERADIDSISSEELMAKLSKGEGSEYLVGMALAERGNILYMMHKRKEAFTAYEKAMQLGVDDAMTLNNYAYFLAKDGRNLEKAEELSRKTVLENPDNPVMLDTYAFILFKLGRYEEALENIQKAINIIESSGDEITGDYYEHLGDIQFKAGNKDAALEMWQKSLPLTKDEKDRELLQRKIKYRKYIEEND